ncbi:MAG: histidine--tRNA ligase [Promethearchaeota archaeon]|nr:MAG: histidine--tRNA ligase [Candidatus Lokiarchaeota archaeon]
MPKFSKDPLRGMEDYYPEDLREMNWIIDNIRDIAETYSYEEFESPQLEPIEIFAAKSSDELVNEQSFIVEKKEGERLILIPELTPSLARMIAKKSQELKKPIRWYSVPTCFRYERPQRGRRRQFKQVNFDILGEDSLYGDLEIFNIIVDIFTKFGATAEQFQIYYNNRRFIDDVCQMILNVEESKLSLVYKALDKAEKMDENEFESYISDIFQDNDIIQGIFKLKKSDSIEDLLKKFDNIPKDFYNSTGYKELKEFETLLKGVNLSEYCTFSSGIVRGLDYYTGIVYEVYDTGTENTRSIFGGGRYDDLLSLFSDEQISGTGFGLGLVMLSLFLETYNLIPQEIREMDYSDTIYIAGIKENVSAYALQLAQKIRAEDFPCIIDYRFSNLKNQLSKANELGNIITLIIGPSEMEENKVTIKNMISEEQITIDKEHLIDEIYNIIDKYGN